MPRASKVAVPFSPIFGQSKIGPAGRAKLITCNILIANSCGRIFDKKELNFSIYLKLGCLSGELLLVAKVAKTTGDFDAPAPRIKGVPLIIPVGYSHVFMGFIATAIYYKTATKLLNRIS